MGAVALASPAQAHHTVVTGTAVCTPTEWVITWTVANWDTTMTATLDVTADPNTPITNIVDGATLPGSTKVKNNWTAGKLVGEQRVPLSTEKVDLTIKGKWTNSNTATNSGHVKLNDAKCGDYKTEVTGSAVCDADTGTWQVSWVVQNKHFTMEANASIITQTGPDAQKSAVKIGGSWQALANENVIVGLKDNDTIPAASTKTATQVVSGDATAARLKVELAWKKNGYQNATDSDVAVVEFDGKCVKNAPKPSVTFASDCTGIVTITLMNAGDATKDATFVVTGAGDWTSGDIVVKKGESVPVTVPKSASANIVVNESGAQLDTYSWQDSTKCHPVEITSNQTCAGLSVVITNPQNGAEATVVLTLGTGTAVTKVVAPGATETVEFEVGQAGLAVGVSVNGEQRGSITWAKPRGCEPIGGKVTSNCTGIVFDLTNPEDGSPAEIVLTPSKGEAVSFTLKPGESKKVEFPANGDKKFSVTASLNGKVYEDSTVVWEKPANCTTPSTPPSLPKTGTKVTTFALGGVLLVGIGAAVFMLARRRRLNLTDVE
jgi:LPXTG-motif cell wall-anchored protein